MHCFRHPGYAVACFRGSVASRPASPPYRQLMQETATGYRPASIHAGMPIADPSPSGGSLRSRRCLFRLISAPKILWGAEMAGLL